MLSTKVQGNVTIPGSRAWASFNSLCCLKGDKSNFQAKTVVKMYLQQLSK